MAAIAAVSIVNVGYRSTNYWVISAGRSRVLVDLGWPGTLGTMRARLARADIPLGEIRYALATHYHLDHAGLAEELKHAGVPLLVLDVQLPFVPLIGRHAKPHDRFTPISLEGNTIVAAAETRALLERCGIAGEILHTPGHSDDSVSLLLDGGQAFTGDLTEPRLVGPERPDVVRASWQLLKRRGATAVYAGHGPVRRVPALDG